ncbi:MAG: AAA family ATPase [Planctomycetales bacterium]
MSLSELIASLCRPGAFPAPVDDVEVRQTHISAVFLGGDLAYKIKKPVQFSFLDFSTLELRKRFCELEVRLNRRLAPDVYLDVVPIALDDGTLRFEGTGEPVEWAVKMRRLPQAATLEILVQQDQVSVPQLQAIAQRLARFHRDAESNPRISAFGRFEAVARNLRENLAIAAPLVGQTVAPAIFDRLTFLTEQKLLELQPTIEWRAAQGVPRDTHGDLHLDHVYLFPDRPSPSDLVIVDCIEFTERFRYTDPVADMAFLAMDLSFHGRPDLAKSFCDAYFEAAEDQTGRALLPLYLSYRAAVRGKVDGLTLIEPEIPESERNAALARARGHWLLALHPLEEPLRRPWLILISGLPGSGKSTLAQGLAAAVGAKVIRSDVVRKELAGLSPTSSAPVPPGGGLYSADWNDRTYAECLRRAEQRLFLGERVIIDATFVEEGRRRVFLEAAVRWGVPALWLLCDSPSELIRQRLAARHSDASDADWTIYQTAAQRWESPGPMSLRSLHRLETTGTPEQGVAAAHAILREAGFA